MGPEHAGDAAPEGGAALLQRPGLPLVEGHAHEEARIGPVVLEHLHGAGDDEVPGVPGEIDGARLLGEGPGVHAHGAGVGLPGLGEEQDEVPVLARRRTDGEVGFPQFGLEAGLGPGQVPALELHPVAHGEEARVVGLQVEGGEVPAELLPGEVEAGVGEGPEPQEDVLVGLHRVFQVLLGAGGLGLEPGLGLADHEDALPQGAEGGGGEAEDKDQGGDAGSPLQHALVEGVHALD